MYKQRLESLEKKYQEEKTKKKMMEKHLEELQNECVKLQQESNKFALQKEIVSQASNQAREAGKTIVKGLCTDALKEIDERLSIEITDAEKYGSSFIDVSLVAEYDNEKVVTDPAAEDAGGLADIVSVAAFVAFNSLNTANKAPIFLDEPTKFVSKNNAESIATFIKNIADTNEKQFFVLTHEQDFLPNLCDKHFSLSKNDNGESIVKKA